MKTKLKILISLIFAFLVTINSLPICSAITENWEIQSFHTDITINENSKIEIVETIIADFSNEAHRGIARIIPYRYTTEKWFEKHNAHLNFISAVDENGNPWKTKTYTTGGDLHIEMINEEETYNNDVNTFIITYNAENVINFFDTHDELFWNVNGTSWTVPIKETRSTITLPNSIESSDTQITCYTGPYGSTEKDCTWNFEDEQTLTFKSNKPFEPFENLSVVIGIPKGILSPPSALKQFNWFFAENWGFFFPPITLIVMLLLWFFKGRDEKTARDTVMPHYNPPEGLSPTETGTIIDEKIHPRDITSTIINFAIKGYIKITETEKKGILFNDKDYELILQKPYETNKEFEKLILQKIFPNNSPNQIAKLSSLKTTFYSEIPKIKKAVMNELIKEKYFPHNPSTIRKIYSIIGIVFMVMGATLLFMAPYSIIPVSPLTIFGFILSGIIISLIGIFLPKKSQRGTEAYYKLKGLYEYIKTAERDRLKFQENNNILFEKLLPYAISFGLIKKWSKAFEGILKTAPAWYVPSQPWTDETFSMSDFGNKISSFNDFATTSITGQSGGAWGGSSGFSGGFSGGGFGGGGGHGI